MNTPAITPQQNIQGLNKTYDAWEFRPGRLTVLPFENLVCISCRMLLPARKLINYIGYHTTMIDFLKTAPDNKAVYSYIFISASDENDALSIIEDIKSVHPELHSMSGDFKTK